MEGDGYEIVVEDEEGEEVVEEVVGGEVAEVEVVLAVALLHLVGDGAHQGDDDQYDEEEDDLVVGDPVYRRPLQRGLRLKIC